MRTRYNSADVRFTRLNGTSTDLSSLMQAHALPTGSTIVQKPWGFIKDQRNVGPVFNNNPLRQVSVGFCTHVPPSLVGETTLSQAQPLLLAIRDLEVWVSTALGLELTNISNSLRVLRESIEELHDAMRHIQNSGRENGPGGCIANSNLTEFPPFFCPHSAWSSASFVEQLVRAIANRIITVIASILKVFHGYVGHLEEFIAELLNIKLGIDGTMTVFTNAVASINQPYVPFVVPFTSFDPFIKGFGSFQTALDNSQRLHKEFVNDTLPSITLEAIDDGFEAGAFLAELPEVRQLFKSMSRITPGLLNPSNIYLMYNFAIRPFIGDMATIMDDLLLPSMPTKVRRYASHVHWSTEPEFYNETRFGVAKGVAKKSIQTNSELRNIELHVPTQGAFWISGACTDLAVGVDLSELYGRARKSHERLIHTYFRGKYDPLKWKDLWELIPFSFLVDYFINIGDLFAYIDSKDKLDALASGQGGFWSTEKLFVGSSLATSLNQAGCTSGWGHCEYKRNERFISKPPLLMKQKPKALQIINIFALIDANARR